MARIHDYYDNTKDKYKDLTKNNLEQMPRICTEFYTFIKDHRQIRTTYSYIMDVKIFLTFLQQSNPELQNKSIKEITTTEICMVEIADIVEFMDYLENYTDGSGKIHHNKENGKARKLASIRSLYSFLVKNKYMQFNPALSVETPKIRTKKIVYLENEEIDDIFTYMENFEKTYEKGRLNQHRLEYFRKTKYRDTALFYILLGTGIRVSECVGLDIKDVDFKKKQLLIVRKGGNEDTVYFNQKVSEALQYYIDNERIITQRKKPEENALFLSLQGTRLTVRAIENLVKKYASDVVPLKPITVHKLRSTFGTSVYRQTRDIYMVSKALGHKDLSVVQRYADAGEETKIDAAEAMKF